MPKLKELLEESADDFARAHELKGLIGGLQREAKQSQNRVKDIQERSADRMKVRRKASLSTWVDDQLCS